MKKIKYLIILGIIIFAFIAGWMMSDREDEKNMLEIYTYEDVRVESTMKNDEEKSEMYTEDVSEVVKYELTKEDTQFFVTFTEEKLDKQMFDELNNENIKNLYEKYKDVITIYTNGTGNMYIADMRFSKSEIKGTCEYDETEQNYKYRIEYGKKVFEDVYKGKGVVVLLISDFSCTKIEEKDLINAFSFINDNSASIGKAYR